MGEVLGLDRPRGAIVASIHPLSPMVQAGVATGDVIVGVNRKPVENAKEFDYRMATLTVGQQTEIDLIRKGKPLSAKLALMRAPDKPAREGDADQGPHAADRRGGRQCLAGTRRRAWPRHLCQRLAVVDVKGGPAASIGFRKGDLLLEINGTKISSVKALQAALTKDSGYWELSVDRNGQVRSRGLAAEDAWRTSSRQQVSKHRLPIRSPIDCARRALVKSSARSTSPAPREC